MARKKSAERQQESNQEERWTPLRDTKCTTCHWRFDPSPEWLAVCPEMKDGENLFCGPTCKRVHDSNDQAAIEARRAEVEAGELDAFSGGMGLVSAVTI